MTYIALFLFECLLEVFEGQSSHIPHNHPQHRESGGSGLLAVTRRVPDEVHYQTSLQKTELQLIVQSQHCEMSLDRPC